MRWDVRPPTPDERAEILRLLGDAFDQEGDADRIVRRTWELDAAPAGLELVATTDGAIIGHVLAAPGSLADCVAVAPLAVAPGWQRQGVGAALMKELLRRAQADGWGVVLVLGDPAYYSRFGFKAAGPLGFTYRPAGPNSPYFMARVLRGPVATRGEYSYCWEPLGSA